MKTIIKTLSALEQALHQRIYGQQEVLSRLFRAIKRRELKTVPQRGPRGAFFFAGPTGVGKTEAAKTVAEVLFGAACFLRIDCSEYKTLASAEGLLGNRAGDRGRLGQAHDQAPSGVWLWDEIEKAHPELVQLFLQMADEGRVTLACGETLDLRNIYLIVTSNLGSAEIIGRRLQSREGSVPIRIPKRN
jgi:ATP-dependent Clp protease ATP-binding subunit ClpA